MYMWAGKETDSNASTAMYDFTFDLDSVGKRLRTEFRAERDSLPEAMGRMLMLLRTTEAQRR